MLKGFFIENRPIIRVALGWNRSVQTPRMLLDTGFFGDLQITRKMATGLEVTGVIRAQIADGSVHLVPTAIAFVSMEEETKLVDVLISEGTPLAGINFLTKFDYKATSNCKNRTVTLTRAA